ncbi:MAG: amidohydrolase family protein [Pyrinomonadaceae bacterium]|nr:amidohydrolase family protein [Pyrinomonadaceae bacterium]
MKKVINLPILLVLLVTIGFALGPHYQKSTGNRLGVLDSHVHLMSPGLVKLFKDTGIPFSKPDNAYTDIEEITERLGTKRFKVISMAYIWGHPQFNKVEKVYEKVKAENDYVLDSRKFSGVSLKAYCGVNPLKDYALKELKRCRKAGADGFKFHFNANQVYLTEAEHIEKIKPLFKYLAIVKKPILLHFDNSHPKTGKRDVDLFFDKVLSETEAMEIQIAHFGTSGRFTDKTAVILDAFVDKLDKGTKKERRHRILFDISAVALDKKSEAGPALTKKEFVRITEYVRKLGPERVVFGSDYPLYTTDEYKSVLDEKLDLTDEELKVLLNAK